MAEDDPWCSRCGAALTGRALTGGFLTGGLLTGGLLAAEPVRDVEPLSPPVTDGPPDPAEPQESPATPARPADPSPLPPRRWRPGRNRATAGALTALLLAGALGASRTSGGDGSPATTTTPTTTRPTPTTAAEPEPTTAAIPTVFLTARTGGVRLVLARNGRLSLVDLDASTVEQREVGQLQERFSQFGPGPSIPLVRRGGHVVFQGEGATWAVPIDRRANPARVGASVLFVPSVVEDRVWLVNRDAAGPTVRELDVEGRPTSPAYRLPVDWAPQGAVTAGLVLTRRDGFEVWDPASGAVRLAGEQGTNVVAAAGDVVAWQFGCDPVLCPLHLTNVRTGHERVVYAGSNSYLPGAFSPDGRTLAMFVQQQQSGVGFRSVLALVDVASGGFRTLAADGQGGTLAWSASGRWVFSLPTGEGLSSSVVAYQVDQPLGIPVRLPADVNGLALAAR